MADDKFDNVLSLMGKLGKTVREHVKPIEPGEPETINFTNPLERIGFTEDKVLIYYRGGLDHVLELSREDAVRLGVILIQAASMAGARQVEGDATDSE